jgi:hypothetical protein
VVSGDAKTEQIIFNVDSRTFEYEGEPDLSVVHIYCPEGSDAIDDASEDLLFHIPNINQPQDGDYMDQKNWSEGEGYYQSIYPRPTAVELNDTDFEHELNVIFQISNQPRYFTSQEDAKQRKSQLNMDFLWSAIGDKTMAQDQVAYEKYQAGSADRAYRRTWSQANNSDTPPEIPWDVTYGPSYAALEAQYAASEASSYGYSYGVSYGDIYRPDLSSSNSSNWGGPWFGEVGRMVIWRAQTRDFMWTLHDEVETSEVVEKVHVEKRDGDVKKTKARKASQSYRTPQSDPLTILSVTSKRHTILMSRLSTSSWTATSQRSSWTQTTWERRNGMVKGMRRLSR